MQGSNGATRNNFELFVRRGMNIEHWYRENSAPTLPWVRVGKVRSADPWRDTFHDDALDGAAAIQSTFNRNFELVYRSTYNQLRHVFFNQASGWWEDGTLFGPQNPAGIPGFIQSNRGAPGDFEVVAADTSGSGRITRQTQQLSVVEAAGHVVRTRGSWPPMLHSEGPDSCSRSSVAPACQNGSGELHYVCAKTNRQMYHYRRAATGWALVGAFGAGVDSAPCLIEGTYGAGDEVAVGNFELCVAVGGTIEHWWRYNASLGPWTRAAVFGGGVRRVIGLIQSTFTTNLELIVENQNGSYQHYFRDGSGWHAGAVISQGC